jgi:hypothetical protein
MGQKAAAEAEMVQTTYEWLKPSANTDSADEPLLLSFRAKRGIWVFAGREKNPDPRFARDEKG